MNINYSLTCRNCGMQLGTGSTSAERGMCYACWQSEKTSARVFDYSGAFQHRDMEHAAYTVKSNIEALSAMIDKALDMRSAYKRNTATWLRITRQMQEMERSQRELKRALVLLYGVNGTLYRITELETE